jgi:pimeloyl-ACP methyl ester carboxylesterase
VIDTVLTLPDGRSLAYTDCGEPADPLVVYFHGAPTSRLDLVGAEESFRAFGVRVVSPDRPGYGGSSPQAGRGFSDWAPDVAALADHLGAERFAVMGLSSGGSYAVACAALLPERIVSAGVVAGVTDMGWPGAWEGYEQSEATLMRIGDEAAAVRWCEEHYGPDGSRFFESVGEMAAADTALLEDEAIANAFFTTVSEAFHQGVGGFAQDITVGEAALRADVPELVDRTHLPLRARSGVAARGVMGLASAAAGRAGRGAVTRRGYGAPGHDVMAAGALGGTVARSGPFPASGRSRMTQPAMGGVMRHD